MGWRPGRRPRKAHSRATADCRFFANASELGLGVSKSRCGVKILASDVAPLETGKEGTAEGYVFIRRDRDRFEIHALAEVRFDNGMFISYSRRSGGGGSSGEGKQEMIGVSGSLEGGVASCSYKITDSKSDGTRSKLEADCNWSRPK